MKLTLLLAATLLLSFSSSAMASDKIYHCTVEKVYSFDMEHRTPMIYENSKFTVNSGNGIIDGEKFANFEYGKFIQRILHISKGGSVYPFEMSSVNKKGAMEYLCINEFEEGQRKTFIYKNVFWIFTGTCE